MFYNLIYRRQHDASETNPKSVCLLICLIEITCYFWVRKMKMEWEKLLSERRIRELLNDKPAKEARPDERTNHGRDYDRSIFSTPVRRLQDKTQVFPLDPNDSVRTRLTHSLEVSNVARNLSRGIGNWLESKGEIDSKQKDSIEIISSTCGLIHDLGNPPFGHSGEKAIAEWFRKQDEKNPGFLAFKGCDNAEQLKQDFLEFEGNAQTIRLVSKLQVLADLYGLNFTSATMSAISKYIAPSDQIVEKGNHEKSKPGFFASEQGLIEKIQKETGTENIKNPITFIVESADDIAYSVGDIEDGVKKGVITWDILKKKLEDEFEGALGKKEYSRSAKGLLRKCFKGAKNILDKAKEVESIKRPGKTRDEAMVQAFRVHVIIESAKAIQKAFKANYESIMSGEYHNELFKDSTAGALITACKRVGQEHIYCAKETLELELMGRRVIHDLMDVFWEGASKDEKDKKSFASKIFDLTSENYRIVYDVSKNDTNLPKKYCCMQLMTDYICGMTDTFACTLHKRLTNG